MWFKNLRLYRLNQPIETSEQLLQEKLEAFSFKPCGSQELSRAGWIAPNPGAADALCHVSQGMIALAVREQERLLPRGVVKEELEKRVRALESAEERRVHRKERKALEDEIMFDMMPRAFTRSRAYRLFVSTQDNLIFVDASSETKAEMMLNLLRESLGSLQVTPVGGKYDARMLLTQWLACGRCTPFELGEECELCDNANEKSRIKLKCQELTSDEVESLLNNGRSVLQLAIQLPGRISALVHHDLSLKRLRYGDVIEQQLNENSHEDVGAEFDAQFTLMALELRGFASALLEHTATQQAKAA